MTDNARSKDCRDWYLLSNHIEGEEGGMLVQGFQQVGKGGKGYESVLYDRDDVIS